MEILQYYEAIFGRQRDEWTKHQWQDVAEQLATAIDARPQPKPVGRPPLNASQKDNIPALAFWADQAVEEARSNGKYLSFREAVARIRMESARKALHANTIKDKEALRKQRITPGPDSEKGTDMLLTSVIKRIEKHKREVIKGK
jgi:hypothetical protein